MLVIPFRQLQAFADEINLLLGRGNAAFRLLLKDVQHLDDAGEAHGVDGAEGVSVVPGRLRAGNARVVQLNREGWYRARQDQG